MLLEQPWDRVHSLGGLGSAQPPRGEEFSTKIQPKPPWHSSSHSLVTGSRGTLLGILSTRGSSQQRQKIKSGE